MKYYFVLSPSASSERSLELKEKSKMFYGSKEYIEMTESFQCTESLKNTLPNPDEYGLFNISLMLIGVTIIAISQCDSIYVANGWEDDNYCKVCHALAFSHGVDIVYESV